MRLYKRTKLNTEILQTETNKVLNGISTVVNYVNSIFESQKELSFDNEFHKYYELIYDITTNNESLQLVEQVVNVIKSFVIENTNRFQNEHDSLQYTNKVLHFYDYFFTQCVYIQKLFILVDNFSSFKGLKTMKEHCKELFGDYVLNLSSEQKLKEYYFQCLTKIRDQHTVEESLLQLVNKVQKMYLTVAKPTVINTFLEEFKNNLIIYYEKHVRKLLCQPDIQVDTYVTDLCSRTTNEKQRLQFFLFYEQFFLICVEKLYTIWIIQPLQILLHKKVTTKSLKQLWQLIKESPGCIEQCKKRFEEMIVEDGKQLLNDLQDPLQLIDQVMILYEKYKQLRCESFENCIDFLKVEQTAFITFINQYDQCTNYTASIIHKTIAKNDFNLQKIIEFCKFLKEKDVFELYHRKLLMKRLLNNSCQLYKYIDIEKQLINNLISIGGSSFGGSLMGMIIDYELSQEINKLFNQYWSTKIINQINPKPMINITKNINNLTNIRLLGIGRWPISNVSESGNISEKIILPYLLQQEKIRFNLFYNETYCNRKLVWLHEYSNVILKTQCQIDPKFKKSHKLQQKRKCSIIVTLYQCCILILFNNQNQYTFKELESQTHIPEIQLKQHLLSLCTGQWKLLQKTPNSKGIQNEDIFHFNESCTLPSDYFQIPLVSIRDKSVHLKEENGKDELLNEMRINTVDAIIVRTMKAKTVVLHNDLIAIISTNTTMFTPSISFIKQRIESLIERDFIKRDENNVTTYKYIV